MWLRECVVTVVGGGCVYVCVCDNVCVCCVCVCVCFLWIACAFMSVCMCLCGCVHVLKFVIAQKPLVHLVRLPGSKTKTVNIH